MTGKTHLSWLEVSYGLSTALLVSFAFGVSAVAPIRHARSFLGRDAHRSDRENTLAVEERLANLEATVACWPGPTPQITARQLCVSDDAAPNLHHQS